jgi:hypothetical protein
MQAMSDLTDAPQAEGDPEESAGAEPGGAVGAEPVEAASVESDESLVPSESREAAADPKTTARGVAIEPRILLMALGVIAGAAGFVGFFLDFFTRGNTSLSAASSGWFDLIPVFIGLSVIGLFIPRFGFVFSGLSLISLGIVFGLRGIFSGAAPSALASQVGYGIGFWMIAFGAGVLAIIWLLILALALSPRAAADGA